jgi:hypothetical protein
MAWTSLGEWKLPRISGPQRDYYNLLVAGFRKGSLALDVKVPESLIKAEDPWDPRKRPADVGMQDISYNKGHYYLYFGVVPAVLLFWPFRAVTGNDLPYVYSSIVYSLGAFLLTSWLWLRILRDRFPRAGILTKIGGLAALGLAGGQLVLARRTSIWEMPIEAGHFYIICMVASGYLALSSRRPWAWLAAAGTSLGLAFGCRPTQAAAGAGLACLVLVVGWDGFSDGGWRGRLRRSAQAALAAGIPLAGIVACLLAYNMARFGHPLEFGLNYQLNSNFERGAHHFSLSFIPYNFTLYFLRPPHWGRYFPFLHPVAFLFSRPAGYYGYEFVYGSLIVCPVLWWAAGLPACVRSPARREGLGGFALFLAAGAVSTTVLLLCFNTAAARYMADFLPWWVWLGALGWVCLEDRIADDAGAHAGWRRLLRGAFAVTAAASCIVAFCASAELHGLLQYWNPSGYRMAARVFDAPVALSERLLGTVAGPIEMDVEFPKAPSGSYEPLVVTGVEYQKDYVFVYYQSATVVRLGYESDGDVIVTSRDIPVVPGRKYRLKIECGSLFPPEGILFFRGYDLDDVDSLKGWVRIDVDGARVLTARRGFNEATPGSLQIGREDGGTAFGHQFTGTITGVKRDGLHEPIGTISPSGDFQLGLALPDAKLEGNQPIFSAGRTGKADILGLTMPDRDHVAIVYESWGIGIWEGEPVALPEGRVAYLRIRFGPLLGVDARSPMAILRRSIVVWMDGAPVWWTRTTYALDPEPAFNQMSNKIGSSEMVSMFQGRLESAKSDPAPAPWRAGPFSAVELDLVGRGAGVEPLVSTGGPGKSDTLSIDWLSGDRARLVYEHAGEPVLVSNPFEWSKRRIHTLRAGMPSLRALDAKGTDAGHDGVLRIDLDGERAWELPVHYFLAPSGSVLVGRKVGGPAGADDDLRCVVADLRQVPE